MAVSKKLRGPFCEGPCNQSPANLESVSEPLILGNSHVRRLSGI